MSRIHSFRNYTVLASNAYARVSVTGAVSLTVPNGANAATIRVIANPSSTAGAPVVNYRLDGTAATTTTGMPLFSGDVIEIYMSEPNNISLVSVDGNAQTVCVEFALVK